MKKQIGNDVRLEWTILRKGVAEDFADATDLSLTAFIPNLSVDEVTIPIARVGNVFTLNIPTTDLAIGTYTIRLQYKKPDPAFVSGKASISTAVNSAFQIVPIGAAEDDLNDELTSNVIYCTDGATFIPSVSVVGDEVILSWTNDKGYENPLPINIKGDKGDVGKSAYQYYLESTTEPTPLTEAEFSTMLGNLPTYVQDAILATSNANNAATNANNAANTAIQAAQDADAAALLANNAADNANTKAQFAQTQGDYAKAQGDYAKAKGDYAHEQGLAAYTAANQANATNDSVQAAENLRVSAESSRVTAESNRVTQENGRIAAENGRVAAEAQRQIDSNTAVNNANNAAAAANTAAQEVENILQNIQTLPQATLYLNSGSTLTPTAPTIDVTLPIALNGTTPAVIDLTYTAPADGFVSLRSTYNPAFYVRNLNTISTYSVTLAWFIGTTKIVEASQSVKPSGTNVLFTFPMTNNLLAANIDYLAGQVFTLRATISKDGVPNQTIEIYSTTNQRSGFTRNGGAIGSGEIVDFNGTNTQTQAQRNRSYEDKLTSFEQTPELATTKTTGFYYGGTTTTLSPFASFTAINLISVKQGDVLVIQGMSAATLALGFQGCEFNASNNKVKEIKAADFVAITGGYKLTIATSTATQLGLHCVNADAAAFLVKRGSTVAETLIWKLKSTSLPPIPDFISQLTKTAVSDELIGIGKKARFIAGVIRTYAHIPFDNGSRLPVANEVLVGATSGKSYTVLSVKLDSGSWASGTAVGHIVIDARANYLSNPYTDLENLQIGGITVARRSSVAVFGGWEQIGGNHESIGILNYSTGTSLTTINFTFAATKIVSMVACPDEGFAGYTMGLSVGNDKAYLRVQKLVASTSTGAISGVIQDYSNLANCINDDNIWLFGIMLI